MTGLKRTTINVPGAEQGKGHNCPLFHLRAEVPFQPKGFPLLAKDYSDEKNTSGIFGLVNTHFPFLGYLTE